MAVRSSMTWLITHLRHVASDADSSVWTDQQLQDYLDAHSRHVVRERMDHNADYTVYYSSGHFVESDQAIYDGVSETSTLISSSTYTANLVDGYYSFSTSQDISLYIDYTDYDITAAAYDCLISLMTNRNALDAWNRGGVQNSYMTLQVKLSELRKMLSPRFVPGRRII